MSSEEESSMSSEEREQYIRNRHSGNLPWNIEENKKPSNPPIRIKIDSHDIEGLLTGKVISVKDVNGQEVQIIAI